MVDVLHLDEEFAVAFIGRVQIQSWRRFTPANLRAAATHAQRRQAQLGEKIVTVTLVSAYGEFPDAPSRVVAAELLRTISQVQLSSATVLEGEGFRASAARAAAAGIMLLSRSPMPQKTFATVEQAIEWLAGFVPLSTIAVAEVVNATKDVRRRHVALQA